MGWQRPVARRGMQGSAELKRSAFSRGEDTKEGCRVSQELPSDSRKVCSQVPGREQMVSIP